MDGPLSNRLRFWAALILLAIPSSARAQDGDTDAIPDPEPALDGPHDPFGLGVKKLAYSLGLKAAGVYDDNIFLTADDPASDTIGVFLLTAKVRHDYGSGAATATYRGRERVFARHPEFDGPEHFVDAAANLKAGDWRFEAGVEYRALKDPFDALQSGARVDSEFDREFVKGTADFGRFGLEVTGSRSRFTVDDETLDRGDYRRWEGWLTGLAEASSKVTMLLTIGGWATRYDEPEFGDFDVLRITAGARTTISSKTWFEASAGYARSEPRGESSIPSDVFSEFVAEVTGGWTPAERHEVRVDLRRGPVESVLSGLALSDELRLGYRYEVPDRWSAVAGFYWERRQESHEAGVRRGLGVRTGVQVDLSDQVYADGGILFRGRDTGDPHEDYENLRISIGMGVMW